VTSQKGRLLSEEPSTTKRDVSADLDADGHGERDPSIAPSSALPGPGSEANSLFDQVQAWLDHGLQDEIDQARRAYATQLARERPTALGEA
jgi:hypothetical protein